MSGATTYVWVLETGEDYEGGYIKDIYSTEEKALAGARQLQSIDCVEYRGAWEPREPSSELSRVWHRPGEWMQLTKREVL